MNVFGPVDEDTLAIRALARDFARREVAPAASGWDAAERLPVATLSTLGELGLLGLATPEAAGGAGLGATQLALVVTELAEASGALAWAVAQTAAAARIIAACAGSSLAADLDGILSGRLRLGVAESVTHDATHDPIRLDPVSFAGSAHRVLVVSEGGELALVDVTTPGCVGRASDGALGLRGLELGAMDAPTSAWRRGGRVAGAADLAGWRALRQMGAAAVALGLGRAALERAVGYAVTRVQFGRPIADFQAVSFKLAEAATELDAAELTLSAAATAFDRDGHGAVAAAEAKLLACAAASLATDEALQIHGGYGYTRDYPVERLWRDARACATLEGTPDALAEALAAHLLGSVA